MSAVVSSLGVVAEMGMFVRCYGIRDWSKRVFIDQKGGIGSSKGLGIQDNDGRGNQPKRYLYSNQISRIGFLLPLGLE